MFHGICDEIDRGTRQSQNYTGSTKILNLALQNLAKIHNFEITKFILIKYIHLANGFCRSFLFNTTFYFLLFAKLQLDTKMKRFKTWNEFHLDVSPLPPPYMLNLNVNLLFTTFTDTFISCCDYWANMAD